MNFYLDIQLAPEILECNLEFDLPQLTVFTYLQLYIMLGFVVDPVIQAIGRTDFEDGLWRGNHLLAGNGLQRVRTIPGINANIVLWGRRGPDSSGGRPTSNLLSSTQSGVQIPAVVLGLNWPRR